MQKIIDYVTISRDTLDDLDDRVKFVITEGWQPFGGVCFHPNSIGGGALYIQAVVKYSEPMP